MHVCAGAIGRSVLGSLNATDQDVGVIGPNQTDPLVYTLTVGNSAGFFSLPFGNLTLLRDVLDFETQRLYVPQKFMAGFPLPLGGGRGGGGSPHLHYSSVFWVASCMGSLFCVVCCVCPVPRYFFNATVTDPQGLSTPTTITLNVTNVNDAPAFTNCPAPEDQPSDFYVLPGWVPCATLCPPLHFQTLCWLASCSASGCSALTFADLLSLSPPLPLSSAAST